MRLEASVQEAELKTNENKTWTQVNFVEGMRLKIATDRGKVYNIEEVDYFTYLRTEFEEGQSGKEIIDENLQDH